jgi:hypothetical protein
MSQHSYDALLLEPTNGVTSDNVGLYAMPIAANYRNTGDRMQTMVDKVGFPVFISDLFAQNRQKIFDMSAKQWNSSAENQFRSASMRRSEFFSQQLEKHGLSNSTKLLGMGDSLGVPAIQGMQLYHENEDPLFDALLLRDGWNLAKHESIRRGFARYIGYTLKDEVHKRRDQVTFDIHDHGFDAEDYDRPDETNLLQKLSNVADMMSSSRNVYDALKLSRRAPMKGFGMYVVLLTNGLSGSQTAQEEFVKKLYSSYALGVAQAGKQMASHGIRYEVDIDDGWHSDLMDPDRAASEILSLLGSTPLGS